MIVNVRMYMITRLRRYLNIVDDRIYIQMMNGYEDM